MKMSSAYALARPVIMPSDLDDLRKCGLTNEELYKIVAPRRTLQRREANNEQLSVVEADRVLRIKHIIEFADRVFGDPEKARRWLRKPSRALDMSIPLELIETEQGGRIVENELGVIDHGMFA
jgi:putative toxin-antitoxin system antitoxin component (TIGR02293 family)